ncbi:MAG: hypothetical protein JSS86_23745, partial [Cyanobacteria bacterium SZAS LIN-2]|nr:hypothetical protein [Cyanobacteria bacterium SZAS LIN-2]
MNALITGVTLNNLTIFTKGVFTGNYNSLATSTAFPINTLSVTAASLKNSGVAVLTPFKLTSNNITLAITGGAPVVLNNTNVASGTPNFQIDSKTAGSNISVTAVGKLTATAAGLGLTGKGNSLALAGSTLDTNGLPSATYFTTDNDFANVGLKATSGTFTLGATGTLLNNGIVGGVTAKNSVTISAPFVTDTAQAVSGNAVTINTGNFKLNGLSSLVGTGAGASLTISNIASGGLTISGTGGTFNKGGTYTGFTNASLQSTNGGVNVGNLFTTVNGTGNMLDSKSVTNLVISANGNVTLPASLSTLNVADSGSIYIGATGLSYAPLASNPQPFLTLAANKGNVTIYLTSDLNVGNTTKGQVDIQVG